MNPRGVTFFIVQTIFTAIAILAVGLRFYARKLTRRRIDTSDYLLVVGLIMTIATTIVGYLMITEGGAGSHFKDITPQQAVTLIKLFIAAPIVWGVATTGIKLSILSFYKTIFVARETRRIIYGTGLVSLFSFCLIVIEPFVQCRPLKYTWDKIHTKGSCTDLRAFLMVIAAINLAIDLAIFCLPLPIFWTLQMARKKKVYISLILLLGLIVCTMSALRIESLVRLNPADFSYTVLDDCIYGGLEVALGTTNACLPFFRPLLKRLPTPCIFSRQRQSTHGSEASSNPRNKFLGKGPPHSGDNLYPLRRLNEESYVARVGLIENAAERENTHPGRIMMNRSVTMSVDSKSSLKEFL